MLGSFFETDNVMCYVKVCDEPYIRKAMLKGGECLVNKDNKRISNIYRKISDFKNGYAIARNYSFFVVIDLEGNEILDRPYSEIRLDEGVICFDDDGLWGIATYDGRIIVQPQYSYIEPFKDSVAMIKTIRDEWGIISRSSYIHVVPRYKSLIRLNSNFFLAEGNGGYGIINYKGRNIIPFKYTKYELSQNKVILTDKDGTQVEF